MKARFNFYYDGTSITRQQFESEIENENWQEQLDNFFVYSSGLYRAQMINDEIMVNVNDFEINEHMSGFYSIKGDLFNQYIEVLGGDSANEDDYNREYFEDVLDRWDGRLVIVGDRFRIETEELF